MNDKFTMRAVVVFLGLFALGGLSSFVILAMQNVKMPGELATLIGTAVGALGTLLANTRSHDTDPQPTYIAGGQAGPGSQVEVSDEGSTDSGSTSGTSSRVRKTR